MESEVSVLRWSGSLGEMRQTHNLVFPCPKPPSDEIREMAKEYYDTHASTYDTFDESVERRSLTHAAIDAIVAGELEKLTARRLLSFACGTGRREAQICGTRLPECSIVGVDLSEEMCERARRNGVHARRGALHEPIDLPCHHFDAAVYLDSFGAIPDDEERISVLSNLSSLLRTGAPLFLDVSNLHDRFEWGPAVAAAHDKFSLSRQGYELGDFFFEKEDLGRFCFWHYFSEEKIRGLLSRANFAIEWCRYIGYAYRSRDEVGSDEGLLFLKAVRL